MKLSFILAICLFSACSNEIFCPTLTPAELPSRLSAVSNSSGYIKVERGKLFYWLFDAEKNAQEKPLVLWLNGGPGSSSLIGLLDENGPITISNTLQLKSKPTNWTQEANILYVDQPIGTGFSTVDERGYDKDINSSTNNMVQFLIRFMQTHDSFMGRDLYIAGESFAGVYIPNLAQAILQYNARNPDHAFNLKGVAIGDGTVDERVNFQTLATYAYDNELISLGKKHQIEQEMLPACLREIDFARNSQSASSNSSCWKILNNISDLFDTNIYDIRVTGSYNFNTNYCYLNDSSVKDYLGVEKDWYEDNSSVFNRLTNFGNFTTAPILADLLQQGMKVIIYNGDQDLIINHYGTQAWVNALANGHYGPWTENETFLTAAKEVWIVDEAISGSIQTGGGLTFILVHEAGHLVPMDQPRAALEILRLLLEEDKKMPQVET